jgi:hypothetical protein
MSVVVGVTFRSLADLLAPARPAAAASAERSPAGPGPSADAAAADLPAEELQYTTAWHADGVWQPPEQGAEVPLPPAGVRWQGSCGAAACALRSLAVLQQCAAAPTAPLHLSTRGALQPTPASTPSRASAHAEALPWAMMRCAATEQPASPLTALDTPPLAPAAGSAPAGAASIAFQAGTPAGPTVDDSLYGTSVSGGVVLRARLLRLPAAAGQGGGPAPAAGDDPRAAPGPLGLLGAPPGPSLPRTGTYLITGACSRVLHGARCWA